MKVVTRFAPSPTGHLHIGGVRTALFNYVFAKKNKGTFLVLIEDTDKERSKDEYIDAIMDGLDWIKLNPDQNPIKQSDRFDVYQKEAKRLIEEGKAYEDDGAIRLKINVSIGANINRNLLELEGSKFSLVKSFKTSAKLCKIPINKINLKGKTAERLGLIGKEKAIACEVILSVVNYDL